MIIWNGHGYLVAVFVFVSALLTEMGTEAAFRDNNYYQREAWPIAMALAIAAVLCFLVGTALDGRGARRLIDPETGEEVVVGTGDHTLFFIKMQWWGPIVFAIAVYVYISRL